MCGRGGGAFTAATDMNLIGKYDEIEIPPMKPYTGEVEATNNAPDRKLRPYVIQRKIANGYSATSAASCEADVQTTIDTAMLKGANPFDVIS